jgi:hypothetical protein
MSEQKTFWEWVKRTFTPDYRVEIAEYLAEARDYVDLKQKMDILQRRGIL